MMLPEPPIGQLSAEQVSAASAEELEAMAESRGIEFERVFEPGRWADLKAGRRVSATWSKENCMRAALLYLDGKGPNDLIGPFNKMLTAQGQKELKVTAFRARAWKLLSDEGHAQSTQNRVIRKWHEFLGPETPEIESELRALEDFTKKGNDMLRRHKMFVYPTSQPEMVEGTQRKGSVGRGKSLSHSDVLIHMTYLRVIEGKNTDEVAAGLATMMGRTVRGEELSPIYSRGLTLEARQAFGFEVRGTPKPWTPEQYRTAASMLLDDEDIVYQDIANALNRRVGGTIKGIMVEGERLRAKKPEEYGNDSWLVAFILEYADPDLFPDDEDRREVAEDAAELHTYESREVDDDD